MLSDANQMYQYERERPREQYQKRMERRLFLLLLYNLTVAFGFFTLPDKHNICTLSEYIIFICIRYEIKQKNSSKVSLFYLFQKLLQINVMLLDNVLASCYRFSCYYRFSDVAINSVNPSFI